MRKPRPFSHSPIFFDDHKDRLAEIEQRARRELGMMDSDECNPENLRGVFKTVQRHKKGVGVRWNSLKLLLLVLVSIVILLALL